jgi:hypothetical protein
MQKTGSNILIHPTQHLHNAGSAQDRRLRQLPEETKVNILE